MIYSAKITIERISCY